MNHYQGQEKAEIYRVVGNRNRNVPKAEAGMQTDANSAILKRELMQAAATAAPGNGVPNSASFDWKQAMAHNARVLSSQEKAMDEYLKRQRAAAEQHIAAANTQLQIQHQQRQYQQVGGHTVPINAFVLITFL